MADSRENVFQQDIINALEANGWRVGDAAGYDRERALYPEEKTLKDTRDVHIEHIMPQTLSAEWRAELGDEAEQHELYVNRWGNLTLLGGKKNIGISNSVFSRKREEYRDSLIGMTQELIQYDRWGIHEIEQRQEHLAKLADNIWRIPNNTAG